MSSRRKRLAGVTVGEHAGLWRDRYARSVRREDKEAFTELINEVANIPVPDAYRHAFDRWRESLSALGAQTAEARVRRHMVVGLGADTVHETGMALHHTWGVPYIPGSALKGLASAYARRRLADPAWTSSGAGHAIAFGTTEAAGYLSFFDALYIPGSVFGNRPLAPDVMTVHHAQYYMVGSSPPADWDEPNPVSFLHARGSYLLAIAGPKSWAQAGLEIVGAALDEWGVGGKTSSGYGRLDVPLAGEGGADVLAGMGGIGGRERWPAVTVRLDPGPNRLIAEHEGRLADVVGAQAGQLIDGLPEGPRKRLRHKKKRRATLDVVVEPLGNAWQIVELTEPDED